MEDPEGSPCTGQRGPEAWWGSQWSRCGCLEAQTPALQTQASCTHHNVITSHESFISPFVPTTGSPHTDPRSPCMDPKWPAPTPATFTGHRPAHTFQACFPPCRPTYKLRPRGFCRPACCVQA